ncbi:hypothetical protein [Flavobacterium reichenbachii]|uniref:Uncharacterized protein n=1 Tax=Flavobacterium reichenbachii TaxID=362418 RepID=A0A085ZFR1_9FLAO|nr:hypothetical protein [Flavobacterium reichenbachii]KFF03275.1 hypothetical protein IW19_20470 [Flavobacterium reichenbachii]OXB15255.1 hypothetical protein B0A68_11075 [Flavobacterium reichenbachii]
MYKSNAEEFLDWFSKIEKFIKDSGEFSSLDSFAYKLSNSRNKNLNRFKIELLSLAELRNAIVHNPRIEGELIADRIKKLLKRLNTFILSWLIPKKYSQDFNLMF